MTVVNVSDVFPIAFKNRVVSNDRRTPMDKARDAAEKRKIVRQEMRRRDLENKIKKGESLTAAEKAELAAIYIATAAEELSKYDPRIYGNVGEKLNCVA